MGNSKFSDWHNDAPKRKRGSTVFISDRGCAGEDVPDMFIEASLDDLAGGWVAVIVDMLAAGDWTLPLVTRSLIVVAERLHGKNVKLPMRKKRNRKSGPSRRIYAP